MLTYEYGNPISSIVLIQMVDDHDLNVIESEVKAINNHIDDFKLIAVKTDNWNTDLSPWNAPAVFGRESFGDGAANTLSELLQLCSDVSRTYYIGGYSLAGLFALWAAYQTNVFSGVAAASPSIWFPGFLEYIKGHDIHSETVYLSLGDKEERVRNPVMSKVGDCIREGHALLKGRGINCILEWNQGNHFKEPDLRTARAFVWVIQQTF